MSDLVEQHQIGLRKSFEYRDEFCQGWDFRTTDELFVYDGRLALSGPDCLIEVIDPINEMRVYKGFEQLPSGVLRAYRHVSDESLALRAIALIIPRARQRALIKTALNTEGQGTLF